MTDGEVRNARRFARKPHRCVWCGWVIPAGARYMFQVYSFDGYLSNAHWHEACVSDSHTVLREMGESEFLPGSFDQPFPGLMKLDSALETLR